MFLRDSCGRGHEYDITVEVGERLPEGLRGGDMCYRGKIRDLARSLMVRCLQLKIIGWLGL